MENHSRKIGIVSISEDLHAKAISHIVRKKGYEAIIFAVDDLARCVSSVIIDNDGSLDVELTDISGNSHHWRDIGVFWWRRSSSPQLFLDDSHDEITKRVVNRCASAHVLGVFGGAPNIRYVNNPIQAISAENKVNQIRAAHLAKLAVPDTLFSNNPERLRTFFYDHNRNIIIKSHYSTVDVPIKTMLVSDNMIDSDANIRMAPAIYQKYIEGDTHYRVVMAGDDYVACEFLNSSVDSRIDLSVPARPTELDLDVVDKLRKCLDFLGLDVGVFDLKRENSGKLFFLEVNQQGQFAYLDAMAGTNSLEFMANYLCDLCNDDGQVTAV
ncbi:ATP-grasp domain-containing protein [Burkholderia vietnamiensis]|uniref:ATP-grasp domain-containing protein n=1 Tax=Burkholderia vietnamiensis TaxID=60552 RepID=UPI000AF97233|nr:hypothetical protein [Burkholderia vietnamiensis]